MADETPRFALPLIAPGQAQKELFHNEALVRLDAALHAVVNAVGLDTPPSAPVAGAAWIVGDIPAGDWSGQAGTLAVWTDGGWRFVAPVAGMSVWLASDSVPVIHDGTAWRIGMLQARALLVDGLPVVGARQAAIAAPDGGAVIDAEARIALTAVLAALRSHGLIAHD